MIAFRHGEKAFCRASPELKAAVVHDWLTGMRGGERVLEAIFGILPGADLFTLLHVPGSVSPLIERRNIRTSFIQRLPGVRKRYRSYLPLFPLAIESLDLSGYDLVISSSHCAAKGVIPPPDALHISYIHTPMRYVWDMYREYFGGKRGLSRGVIGLAAHYLRMWDASSSARVDSFVANSGYVAARVEKYYRREASVIYPPVDCSRFAPSGRAAGDFYLIVSAFAPYKRVDLAIEAFKASGKKLVIIGSGQDEQRLRKLSGPNIEFLGWRSDSEIADYYSRSRAVILPAEEDFGIAPVEAMASGRPVIAFGRGGALETVLEGDSPTGVFFREKTPAALMKAVEDLESGYCRFDPERIRAHALRFDQSVFKEKMREHIFKSYEAWTARRRGRSSV